MKVGLVAPLAAAMSACVGCVRADAAPAPLVMERTITLPKVAGRIDHLAIDPANRRLIVAELANDTVDIVDLERGGVVHRISDLHEPQGLAFDLAGRTIIVAEGTGGDARLFDAESFRPVATIALGEDADNVRIDPRNGHAIVGYGRGALAVVDLDSHTVLSRIALPAHPESFQIEPGDGRVFVNLPGAHTIGVVDLDRTTLLQTWHLPYLLGNFPLALEPGPTRLAVVFRMPARLVVFDRRNGSEEARETTCGDSDDLFFDSPRRRLYAVCGSGSVDVFEVSGDRLRRAGKVSTNPGARTALFVPALDRLFVAARAKRGDPDAAILVFRPTP